MNVSPFVDLGFPMVSGFGIESMHTFDGGAFRRRLVGIASLPTEGKLDSKALVAVNERLTLFEKCKQAEFDSFFSFPKLHRVV